MDGTHIAELVLLGGHDGDVGVGRLGREGDDLAAACGGGHGQDVVVARQSNDGTLRSADIDTGGGCGDLRRMADIHRSGHYGVECQEGIAVCREHLMGDGLVVDIVGP